MQSSGSGVGTYGIITNAARLLPLNRGRRSSPKNGRPHCAAMVKRFDGMRQIQGRHLCRGDDSQTPKLKLCRIGPSRLQKNKFTLSLVGW